MGNFLPCGTFIAMARPPIQDEFTGLNVSRQRKRQLRWQKAGRCIICGKKCAPGTQRCQFHREQVRAAAMAHHLSRPL